MQNTSPTGIRGNLVAALLFAASLLAGCTDSAELEKLTLDRNQAIADVAAANTRAAVAETELKRRDEVMAQVTRQAEADRSLTAFARVTVRDSQLTDLSGCRIVPASLARTTHFTEFGSRLSERYLTACQQAVRDYRAEREQVAQRTTAAEQKRLAKAKSAGQKIAKANKTPR
jgi:hypothetical protein